MIDRRNFVIGAAALAAGCATTHRTEPDREPAFAAIRATLGPGARMGVAARDTGSGRTIGTDVNARYAMASTFKALLAAAVLAAVDAGRLRRDQPVRFSASDVLEYAPVVKANLSRGTLTLEALCAAAVEVSDNSAANLLLDRIGGPAGLTRFLRDQGDAVTRLDRTEPALNENLPGDPRDTTTPAAMIASMQSLLVGRTLSEASGTRLEGWMTTSGTGLARLRAGLPAGWRAGDKTGTGARGANNDIAIVRPPGRAPILIASYQDGGDAPLAVRNAAHASVARLVAAAFS